MTHGLLFDGRWVVVTLGSKRSITMITQPFPGLWTRKDPSVTTYNYESGNRET